MYEDTKTIEDKKEYISKLKIKYEEYQQTYKTEIILDCLKKFIKYKRSGLTKQAKAELNYWIKYIEFLEKNNYNLDIEIYFGCSRVTLNYNILTNLLEKA